MDGHDRQRFPKPVLPLLAKARQHDIQPLTAIDHLRADNFLGNRLARNGFAIGIKKSVEKIELARG